MLEGGFNLKKWEINETNLREEIREHEGYGGETSCSEATYTGVVDDIGSSDKRGSVEAVNSVFRKALGVTWDSARDDFVFCFESFIKLASTLPYTKRNTLKINASFFDLHGQLSAIILQCKLLFKLIFIDKSNWDTLINVINLVKKLRILIIA